MLHSILIHALFDTLVQTTGPTLVPMGFVDRTLVSTRTPGFAYVLTVATNGSLYLIKQLKSCQNLLDSSDSSLAESPI